MQGRCKLHCHALQVTYDLHMLFSGCNKNNRQNPTQPKQPTKGKHQKPAFIIDMIVFFLIILFYLFFLILVWGSVHKKNKKKYLVWKCTV